LALGKYAYTKFGIKVGKFALINHIKKLKSREQTAWLKEIDSQAIQQSIANMDKAYQHFFKVVAIPNSKQSYQYPQRVKIDGNKIYLPKVGCVKMRGSRKEFEGKIKTITVSYEAYQYHASVMIDIEEQKQEPCNNINKAIGIDVGVSLIVADSNGNKIRPLKLERTFKT